MSRDEGGSDRTPGGRAAGTDVAAQRIIVRDLSLSCRIGVTDEERAKLDAAVLKGMAQIYADYAELGITNAEEIYSMMNE